MNLRKEIFRQYDIRGIAGDSLNRDSAFLIGKAFGTLLKRKIPSAAVVSVGRDVRLSSEELASGVIDGITSTGLDVIDIGVCPTPLQYFSLFHLNLDGGIMVTGSHNPPEYNGFKVSIGRETIYGEEIQRIRQMIDEDDLMDSLEKGRVKKFNIIRSYQDYMLREFLYLRELRCLNMVIDAGNGTAGPVIVDILRELGCEVMPLYCEPDGRFPNHHPDPTIAENMQGLIRAVTLTGAEIGVGYDGDADRIGVVDRKGRIIWGDQLMIVLARDILKERPGAKVIGDVKCSQAMFDDVKERGGIPVMWKTGYSLVKDKMKEEGAVLAGEFSGHIFIADRYFGYDDAIYTTLRLIEILKKTGRTIDELLMDIPEMAFTPEIRIECHEEKKWEVVGEIVRRMEQLYKNRDYRIRSLNTIDGVRIVFDRGWGLIRVSNTQPVIVMRVEAEDDGALREYKTFLDSQLREVMSG